MQSFIVLSVFDKVSLTYGKPHVAINKADAIRQFKAACENVDTDLNKFSTDYELYEIGVFNSMDSESAILLGRLKPELLARASDFVFTDVASDVASDVTI